MTDKQIIIDGVDVSGCSLYEDNPKYRMWGTCDCMRSMVDQSGYDELAGAECKGYNCYYKQLKRKEQECEDLKKLAETHCAEIINMQRELDQLTEELAISIQENEDGREINAELKAENEVLEKVNKTNQEKIKKLNEQVEEEFIAQQYGDMALFWKVEDYKQALTEIKEIITKSCIDIDDNDYVHLSHMKQILQKCEVIEQ